MHTAQVCMLGTPHTLGCLGQGWGEGEHDPHLPAQPCSRGVPHQTGSSVPSEPGLLWDSYSWSECGLGGPSAALWDPPWITACERASEPTLGWNTLRAELTATSPAWPGGHGSLKSWDILEQKPGRGKGTTLTVPTRSDSQVQRRGLGRISPFSCSCMKTRFDGQSRHPATSKGSPLSREHLVCCAGLVMVSLADTAWILRQLTVSITVGRGCEHEGSDLWETHRGTGPVVR